jgi:hypothetical protein
MKKHLLICFLGVLSFTAKAESVLDGYTYLQYWTYDGCIWGNEIHCNGAAASACADGGSFKSAKVEDCTAMRLCGWRAKCTYTCWPRRSSKIIYGTVSAGSTTAVRAPATSEALAETPPDEEVCPSPDTYLDGPEAEDGRIELDEK